VLTPSVERDGIHMDDSYRHCLRRHHHHPQLYFFRLQTLDKVQTIASQASVKGYVALVLSSSCAATR